MSATAHPTDISRFLLKPDKQRIIAEYGLCYYINNHFLSSLGAEMDGKLILIENEFPSNYTYGYADQNRRLNGPWLSFSGFLLGSI
jgi:hypothetical protein